MSFPLLLVSFTDQRWQLLIRGVVYQFAGDNCNSAISFINLRCHLTICWSKLLICRTKMVKTGTITQLLTEKKIFPLHNPFKVT